MFSRFRAILLLVALLWQILPVLSPLGVAQRATELEHVSFHGLDIDHHHHDAQSLHVDDTGGTSMHFHADGEVNTVGPLTTGWSHVATVQLPSPDTAADPLFPSAYPEGPLRPPPDAPHEAGQHPVLGAPFLSRPVSRSSEQALLR